MSSKKRLGLIMAGTVILIAVLGAFGYALWNQVMEVKKESQHKAEIDAEYAARAARQINVDDFMQLVKNGDPTALTKYKGWIEDYGDVYPVNDHTYFLSLRLTYDAFAAALISVVDGKPLLIDEKTIRYRYMAEVKYGEEGTWGIVGDQVLFGKFIDNTYDLYLADLEGNETQLFAHQYSEKYHVYSISRIFPPLADKEYKFSSSTLDAVIILEALSPQNVLAILQDTSTQRLSFNVPNPESSARSDSQEPENLSGSIILRPGKPHVDWDSNPQLKCFGQFDDLRAALDGGTAKDAEAFEACAKILGKTLTKYQVPQSNSYYGFIGNTSAGCWLGGGCYLYLVNNQKTSSYEIGDFSRPIKASQGNTLLLEHFPSEGCSGSGSSFEMVDYPRGTKRNPILSLGDDCQKTMTITFYPHGAPVLISAEKDKNATFYFKGQPIGNIEDGKDFPWQDIDEYVGQSDLTKFYFTAASSSYVLDLSPSIPMLIKR